MTDLFQKNEQYLSKLTKEQKIAMAKTIIRLKRDYEEAKETANKKKQQIKLNMDLRGKYERS